MPEERVTEAEAAPAAAPVAAAPPAPPEPSEDWETRYKYLFADFENFRRRTDRDREAVTRQARGALLRELLPILEAFHSAEEAIAHLPRDHPVRQGMTLLSREWGKLMKHEGVAPVAEVGHPFRTEECEAVGEVPSTDQSPPGTVAEIVQQGYRYFGGLLRPAKVLIARPAAPNPPEPESAAAARDPETAP